MNPSSSENPSSGHNENPQITADKIVEKHTISAFLAALVPYPFVDLAMVTAIQIDMVEQLTIFYGKDFDRQKVKVFLSSILSAGLGRYAGKIAASGLKAIPGIGTILGMSASSVMSAASTYATGRLFIRYYENNESIFDAPASELQEWFAKYQKAGREIIGKWKNKREAKKIYDDIARLHDMKEKGIISEEDFERAKKEALDKLSEMSN